MNTKENAESDLRMVERLLEGLQEVDDPSIQEGKAEFCRFYGELQAALAAGNDGRAAADIPTLQELFRRNPDMHGVAMVGIAKAAFKFIQSECERFARIKEQRPLTDAEKEYGRTHLMGILESLSVWLRDDPAN